MATWCQRSFFWLVVNNPYSILQSKLSTLEFTTQLTIGHSMLTTLPDSQCPRSRHRTALHSNFSTLLRLTQIAWLDHIHPATCTRNSGRWSEIGYQGVSLAGNFDTGRPRNIQHLTDVSNDLLFIYMSFVSLPLQSLGEYEGNTLHNAPLLFIWRNFLSCTIPALVV